MNYRHSFHAGNFADVFKHVLLARILVYMTRKEQPLRYLDTHAGTGLYDLSAPDAERGGEWRDGVGRLASAAWSPEAAALLGPYLRALGPFDGDGGPNFYPGSPVIAQRLLRANDRMIFCEAHPHDVRKLQRAVGRDRRVKTIEIDGYMALRAYLPPVERRGLVLIDPPFEAPDEFARIRGSLGEAYQKWSTGAYAIWRPLKDLRAVRAFDQALVRDGLERLLRLDFLVRAIRDGEPLAGCGLLIVNPPYGFEAEAKILLPELVGVLSRGEGAAWSADWVAA